MSKSAYLADRVQDTGTGLVVGSVDESNVGVIFEGFLDFSEVGTLINREFEVDVGKSVELADLNGSCAVCAVVHNEYLLALGEERVDAHVDVDRARTAEEYGCVFFEVAVNYLYEVFAESLHETAEVFFTGADVRNYLCVLYGISSC